MFEGQQVRRRDFIALVGRAAAAWPLAARAAGQPVRIGFVDLKTAARDKIVKFDVVRTLAS